MKKLINSLLSAAMVAVTAITANAQTPQLINYQAVARNSSGNIISSQPISVRLTIHDGSGTGTVQYQETQSLTTNIYGLFNMQVGGGTVVAGTIASVTWSSGAKYLQVEMDPTGGSSYVDMGTQQLITVPYSFYSDKAGSAAALTGNVTMSGDVTGTNSAATVVKLQGNNISAAAPTIGQALEWNGTSWIPTTLLSPITYTGGTGINIAGPSISALNTTALWNANELQGNSISATAPTTGQVLSWNGTAWTPSAVTGDNWGSQVVQHDVTLTGNGTAGTPLGATNTTALWNANKLEGNAVSAAVPVTGQILQWSGAAWTPTAVTGTGTVTSVTAGTGLSGGTITTSGTISMPNVGTAGAYGSTTQVPVITTDAQGRVSSVTNTAITGDNWGSQVVQHDVTLTGNGTAGTPLGAANTTALWNANKLEGNAVSATAPATGQGLVWSGIAWTPTTLAGTIYTSGTGINIVGGVINAQTTTALWNANELQGNNVSATAPATGQVLSWNGSAWTPTAVGGTGTVTSVTAGAGLSGGTITTSGTISMPIVGTAGTYGSTTQVPVLTTDAQGRVTGVTNTAITGDNWGSAVAHTDATLAGSGTVATPLKIAQQGATTGQVLSWNGVTWLPAASSSGWGLTGNPGTDPTINFVGTTDAQPLRFRINNNWAGEINNTTINTSFGYQSAGGVITTGTNNTAFGQQALSATTTGSYNTATGYRALYSNTTGIQNTAYGSQSLYSNTTGNYNTATGYTALITNTTGSENTAVGFSSLNANTTGIDNTATGSGSLRNNTTGNYNTAGGWHSLYANTTGGFNTANGYSSLTSNTTGAANTATGYTALSANTTGNFNTADGNNALSSNTTGSANVAMGNGALNANTIGLSNTAIGNSALTGNTTGNYNTANGNGALSFNSTGIQNTATGSNSLQSNSTGNYNTGSGYQALGSNTVGWYNTASGNLSLASNTIGYGNTATGCNALQNNIIANYNTADGNQALQFNTTGIYNTATGSASLQYNTTGSNNIAAGSNALQSNTTGYSNVAIGTNALYSNTTIGNNVAVGDSALYNQNGGIGSNTAVGSKALYSNSSGYNNSADGYQALYSNTTGGSNVAEGYQALYYNTTGANNTATGYQALFQNSAGISNTAFGKYALSIMTTGGQNTAIGYNACPTTSTLNNWNAIGFNAGGAFSTSNSVELGNTSITTIRAEVTGITAISDRRIKDNVKANVPGLDFISRLRPVTYNLNIHRQNEILYKNKKDANKDWEGKYDVEKITMSGFIAQEVDQAAKDAGYDFSGVERPATPDGLYGVRYTDFIMPLVKSVQELNTENEAQKKTITGLQQQVAELMKRMKELESKK